MLDLLALSSAEISLDAVDRCERRFELDAEFSRSGANLFAAKMRLVSHEGCLSIAARGACRRHACGSVTIEAGTIVPRRKVQRGANGHDTSWIDGRHTHVVVALDVLHVDGLGNAGNLIEIAKVI